MIALARPFVFVFVVVFVFVFVFVFVLDTICSQGMIALALPFVLLLPP